MSDFEEQLRKLVEAYTRDISSREEGIKKLEEDIRRLNEENRLLRDSNATLTERVESLAERTRFAMVNVHTVAQPVIITDSNSKVRYVSDSFLQMTGYSIEHVLGKDVSNVMGEVHLPYTNAQNLGVEKLHVNDARIPAASGKKIPISLKVFLNKSYEEGAHGGMTIIFEPRDALDKLKAFFSHMISRGQYHEVKAEAFAEQGSIVHKKEFLEACIRPYGIDSDPKKKTVLVNLEGVLECDGETLSHLAEQHIFYAREGYQMLVIGVDPDSDMHKKLATATFPTDYIFGKQPILKQIQKGK